MTGRRIAILGIFVADVAFRTPRKPEWGETVIGSGFQLGPGGKGSNQAVAAARLGGTVGFISKLGEDTFGEMARRTYAEEGIDTAFVFASREHATGAAAIIIDDARGENAIIVYPGACNHLTAAEVEQAGGMIAAASVFVTNLELPVPVVLRGLELARHAGVPTILNPAPAVPIPAGTFGLCDYMTPNESEASGLTGLPIASLADAERAADALLARGVRNVVITLGENGALVRNARLSRHLPAVQAGPVVETTGAGDAFNGGFAIALAEGADIVAAARFGCAVAGLSVTRAGTAPSMPRREEVDRLLRQLAGSGA
ncbi:MAG: ribokinase [Rhodospirillales bacterium]|nr:ribokinase [Rhodospirillales bacterium]